MSGESMTAAPRLSPPAASGAAPIARNAGDSGDAIPEPAAETLPRTAARLPFASRVARGLAWNQASKVIEMAAAYAASVVVARALGPVEFGTYSVALSMVTFTYFATSLGLNEVLNVHIPRLAQTPARSTGASAEFRNRPAMVGASRNTPVPSASAIALRRRSSERSR